MALTLPFKIPYRKQTHLLYRRPNVSKLTINAAMVNLRTHDVGFNLFTQLGCDHFAAHLSYRSYQNESLSQIAAVPSQWLARMRHLACQMAGPESVV